MSFPAAIDHVPSPPQTIFMITFVFTVLWTTAFLGLVGVVGYRFTQQVPQSPITLRLLRAVAMLSATTLFLPFTSVLFEATKCSAGGYWYSTSLACFHTG